MIDGSEAFLRAQSEFIVEHDITPVVRRLRETLDRQKGCNQEALALDEQWEASGLTELIDQAAQTFGSGYVYSSSIAPGRRSGRKVELPLRLGARVRDVFIASDGLGSIEAVRGQLLMHRTKDKESGFFVLLSKRRDDPVPRLSFGRTDLNAGNKEQLALEVLLAGDSRGFLSGHRPTEATEMRERLQTFDPGQIIDENLAYAKTYNRKDGKPWEATFIETHTRESGRADRYGVIDTSFGSKTEGRRFRRDITTLGFLRQHESSYVPGQSLDQITSTLQLFFNDVAKPLLVRPDLRADAEANLRAGVSLELVDTYQVSEIDVAKGFLRRGRPAADTLPLTAPIPSTVFTYDVKRALERGYDQYPELKEHIDTFVQKLQQETLEATFPGISELLKQDSIDLDQVRQRYPRYDPNFFMWNVFDKFDFYKGDNAGGLFGIPWDIFDKLMGELAQIKVAPSPEAFPYD